MTGVGGGFSSDGGGRKAPPALPDKGGCLLAELRQLPQVLLELREDTVARATAEVMDQRLPHFVPQRMGLGLGTVVWSAWFRTKVRS